MRTPRSLRKARLNAEHPATVFAAMDDVERESQQVADALLDHLHTRFPDRYANAVLAPDLQPLDAAARLVPEDLVLMVERDGRLVFGAGSVCFPNRWDLRSKIGLSLADVHRPGRAVERAARRARSPGSSIDSPPTAASGGSVGGCSTPTTGTRRPMERRPPAPWHRRRSNCSCGSSARRCAGSRRPTPCCSRSAPTSPRSR